MHLMTNSALGGTPSTDGGMRRHGICKISNPTQVLDIFVLLISRPKDRVPLAIGGGYVMAEHSEGYSELLGPPIDFSGVSGDVSVNVTFWYRVSSGTRLELHTWEPALIDNHDTIWWSTSDSSPEIQSFGWQFVDVQICFAEKETKFLVFHVRHGDERSLAAIDELVSWRIYGE